VCTTVSDRRFIKIQFFTKDRLLGLTHDHIELHDIEDLSLAAQRLALPTLWIYQHLEIDGYGQQITRIA
jgi:hypothetical protein